MVTLLLASLMMSIIPVILIVLNMIISKKKKKNREKMSPFECGFDQITSSRLPFSLQFFTISLMFLIFDIEIIIMIPFMYLLNLYYNFYTSMTLLMFLFILIFTLWLEWSFNLLKWVN